MSRPTLLVVTLLVLWLIVLVPMIFRRVDDGAHVRSVRRFGRSMRALGRQQLRTMSAASEYGGRRRDLDEVSYVAPRIAGPRDELFVAGAGRAARPVRGQEGQMNRAEMSDGRRHMMARRRRSLTVLIGGSLISVMLAFLIGGTLLALTSTAFCLGLGGYVYFLRTQALRHRERREWRTERAIERITHSHERYVAESDFDDVPETVVRIDDDNIELQNLDTIDLTGIYSESDFQDLRERRAS